MHISTNKAIAAIFAAALIPLLSGPARAEATSNRMEQDFHSPPDSARPGVYWYFQNGNLNGKEMTADLEFMKAAGLGNLLFLEVDIGGLPQGPVAFMSPKWQELFVQSVRDAERLGIDISLGIGPGWSGSGGPWVKPEQAMQHLLFSSVELKGPQRYSAILPLPAQRGTPWHATPSPFYEDVAVLAFPSRKPLIADIDEKALFLRFPYSIRKDIVRPYLLSSARHAEPGPEGVIQPGQIVDLTKQLKPDGTLEWNVPAGDWTIVRMGRRPTMAVCQPAPSTAIGLECDKFDTKALDDHLDHYLGVLLDKIGPRAKEHGLTTLHMDSWEMGSQNWTSAFLDEFKKRRGYDARPWLLAYTGRAVDSLEKTERFLWDLRLTAQELVLENHAGAVKKYGRKHGLSLSIQPYDMNPSGDLDLGAVADVPMGEFWNNAVDSAYSVFEATSIAHVMGKPIVGGEAFTCSGGGLDAYPWSLKNQGDWAFCVGINRFVFHTFAHQALGDAYRPGIDFWVYGVDWHRNQTWWPMVGDYHRYLTRCSQLLRQGVTVSDVLYLTPEGTPHIFLAPPSALEGDGIYKDKKGYGFDGCSPRILIERAAVKDGRIAFPGGTSYRLMVLPQVETMTPALLAKIRDLVKAGATVVGTPPVKSPSLSGYPACDGEVQALAKELWGSMDAPKVLAKRNYGKGVIHWGGELSPTVPTSQLESICEREWIWYPEGNPEQSVPAGTRYFQRIINVDAKKDLASAVAAVTADNKFTLWINGKKVSEGDNFNVDVTTPIKSFLRPGANVIAVAAENSGPGPAGWIGAFELCYKDGSCDVVKTDSKWSAGQDAQPGWEQATTQPSDWKAVKVLGSYTMAPWNRRAAFKPTPTIYPSYDLTASLLAGMGVKEDFSATGPVRYGHRRTNDRDIYFVSNRTGNPIKTDCRFRVGQGSPQLWDPVAGEMRPLPQFSRADGLTSIPMEFDAFQSFFVVFSGGIHKTESRIQNGEKNFPELKASQELGGAWDVAFDPKWGGPEKVAFETLQDWTTRPETGIKYYSGIATYRKNFAYHLSVNSDRSPVFLNLGTVHDMARVKLNGKDLGVVWCAPWRVEISDALKTGENQLEIEVVNRWQNRLIGDKQPADADARTVECPPGFLGGKTFKAGRYTFSTTRQYSPNSPLLPSGLLGPVRVLAE